MQIRIVSFNIRFRSDPDGNSVAERAPRLHAVIAPYDADIIGLQEYSPEWEMHIEKYFGGQYEMFNKYRSTDVDVESSPILWKKDKFDCVGTGYFWLSDTPTLQSRGWDKICECYRMCVYAILKDKTTGTTFTFMNTHFGFGDYCQQKSAELVADYSRKISSLPTVLVGDFNMTPDSIGYKTATKYFTDVNAATVNDLRSTYHGYRPDKIKNEHIDYCFIGDNVTPVTEKIIDELVDGKFPSDHYGLFVKVEL